MKAILLVYMVVIFNKVVYLCIYWNKKKAICACSHISPNWPAGALDGGLNGGGGILALKL